MQPLRKVWINSTVIDGDNEDICAAQLLNATKYYHKGLYTGILLHFFPEGQYTSAKLQAFWIYEWLIAAMHPFLQQCSDLLTPHWLEKMYIRTSFFLKWLIVMTTSRKIIPHTQWAVMACHQFLFDKIEAVSQSLLQPINLCTPLPWQQLKPTTSCDSVYTILQWNSSFQLILSPLSHGPPNPDSQSGSNPN